MSSLTWKSISILGQNKVINKSYVYLILVPIFAKILSRISSPLNITIGNSEFDLDLELPFSWKMFFFSALLFTVGSILYQFFSPLIIKENKSFGDFLVERKNFSHLISYKDQMGIDEKLAEAYGLDKSIIGKPNGKYQIEKALSHLKNGYKKTQLLKKFFAYHNVQVNLVDYNRSAETINGMIQFKDNKHEQYLEWAFWTLYKYANKSNPVVLYTTLFFYLLGILLISWVFLESVYAVVTL